MTNGTVFKLRLLRKTVSSQNLVLVFTFLYDIFHTEKLFHNIFAPFKIHFKI